jgi:hypothetical protein
VATSQVGPTIPNKIEEQEKENERMMIFSNWVSY